MISAFGLKGAAITTAISQTLWAISVVVMCRWVEARISSKLEDGTWNERRVVICPASRSNWRQVDSAKLRRRYNRECA